MELPRGKFRSLEKNTTILSLLRHLHAVGFRGTCRINRDGSRILLVFDQGRIILAEYDNLVGDVALGMISTHRFARIDAIIADLDEAQIRLSLEFNPWGRVQGNQEPSWIVFPRMTQGTGWSFPEGSEQVREKILELVQGSEMRSVPDTVAVDEPDRSSAAETSPEILHAYSPGRPGEPAGMPVVEAPDGSDWRKALAMPIFPSQDVPVSSLRPGPDCIPIPIKDMDGKAVGATPLDSPAPRKIIPPNPAGLHPEEPVIAEGWRKALYAPLISERSPDTGSGEESRKDSGRIAGTVGGFELLSPDSGLFDDIPHGKKVTRVPAPEPAEHWKSMGINRGENSSV